MTPPDPQVSGGCPAGWPMAGTMRGFGVPRVVGWPLSTRSQENQLQWQGRGHKRKPQAVVGGQQEQWRACQRGAIR